MSEISVANTPKLEEASRTMDEVQLESYISSVTDILPDLGVGFIEECLLYYNYQVEKVVDALLTDSLPQCLKKLDISMPRKAKKAQELLRTDKKPIEMVENDLKPLKSNNLKVEQQPKSSENNEETRNREAVMRLVKMQELEEEAFLNREYEDEYDDTYEVGVSLEAVGMDATVEKIHLGRKKVEDDEREGQPEEEVPRPEIPAWRNNKDLRRRQGNWKQNTKQDRTRNERGARRG